MPVCWAHCTRLALGVGTGVVVEQLKPCAIAARSPATWSQAAWSKKPRDLARPSSVMSALVVRVPLAMR